MPIGFLVENQTALILLRARIVKQVRVYLAGHRLNLIAFAISISLASVVSALARILTFVCFCLSMTVWANQSEIG